METTQNTRVYIVEDSAPIRARLAEMLSVMERVSVVGESGNAREAVAGILRVRPDSVLLDLNLMGRTGIDVMRSVHPKAPEIVFVVLTNHAEPQYRRAATEGGPPISSTSPTSSTVCAKSSRKSPRRATREQQTP